MEASIDSLYVPPAGALSPSLWDDDWWGKPDAFSSLVKDDLPLGSPASPFPTSSLDASLFPNDDTLNWMEKSYDLESLTELHDVSVQDVDQMPVQDLKQPQQMEEDSKLNPIAQNESQVSNNLFNVEGLEDLFHDYIDPQVYTKVKDERRVSVDSGISSGDLEDSVFLPATESEAEIDIAAFNNKVKGAKDCNNEVSKPVQAPGIIGVVPMQNVVPQPQYQHILPKPVKEDTKLLKLIPAGSQQPVLVRPIFVGSHNVSLQINPSQTPSKVQSQVFQVPVLGSTKNNQVLVDSIVQARRIQKVSPYQRPSAPEKQVLQSLPKSLSMQRFLGSLRKAENLIPLNALLEESNDLIKSSSIVDPPTPPQPEIIITCDPDVSQAMGSQVEIIDSIKDESTLVSSFDGEMIPATVFDSPIVQTSPHASDISVESPQELEFEDSPTYTVSIPDSPSQSPIFEEDASPIVSFDECLSPGTSYGGSTYTDVDQEWSPSMQKSIRGRRRITTTEERKSRKKVQNKEAAIRYRQKKRDEVGLFLQEEQEQIEKNKKLQNKCSEIITEMKYLKGLLRDLYKAKGLI